MQTEEEKVALKNAMDAKSANQDEMNEILQREQNLLDRVGALESQIDDIQEENRVKYELKTKETDRLLVALKEAEFRLELIKAQEIATTSTSDQPQLQEASMSSSMNVSTTASTGLASAKRGRPSNSSTPGNEEPDTDIFPKTKRSNHHI